MKNFIAVFDGYRMSESTLTYAMEFARNSDAMITGVFLDAFYYHNYDLKRVLTQEGDHDKAFEILQENDRKQRASAVVHFQEACIKAGIVHAVHRDESVPIQELKTESMFADLMIINEHETFSRYIDAGKYEFIDEVMAQTYCPVVIVPDEYIAPMQLIGLYDGSPSSILSFRMFGNLLNSFSQLPFTLFSVDVSDADEACLPEDSQIKVLANRIFQNVFYRVVKGDVRKVVLAHIDQAPDSMILLGAHQLNALAKLFVDGLADELLIRLNVPVMVAPGRCT
jgi:hypothetical protein